MTTLLEMVKRDCRAAVIFEPTMQQNTRVLTAGSGCAQAHNAKSELTVEDAFASDASRTPTSYRRSPDACHRLPALTIRKIEPALAEVPVEELRLPEIGTKFNDQPTVVNKIINFFSHAAKRGANRVVARR